MVCLGHPPNYLIDLKGEISTFSFCCVTDDRRAAESSQSYLRSKPPPVQAPPTLAPNDPLSLAPFPELPYLFTLEVRIIRRIEGCSAKYSWFRLWLDNLSVTFVKLEVRSLFAGGGVPCGQK